MIKAKKKPKTLRENVVQFCKESQLANMKTFDLLIDFVDYVEKKGGYKSASEKS
jgi:hypothetical protein